MDKINILLDIKLKLEKSTTLVDRIRFLRDELGYSLIKVSELTGYCYQHIKNVNSKMKENT
ncbi:hypothetical protein [Bacillus sp. OAE603]|uniref:hypothetical protein n=1 Tax=Gottfriedia sp. OAE603 TaxID=2663872 RepID=UPI00178BA0F1